MRVLLPLPLALLLVGCTALPVDVEGTFDRASGGTLVVGVSEHPPWAHVDDEGRVTGSEADLITSFADSIDADIEWTAGPESVLADKVRRGEVDVVVGGLTASSPWMDSMALTRPYQTVAGEKMVMGVRLGENELLVNLERHLAREFGEIQ
ncbi:hypothetical protein B842_00880 [Corynebacterium humireducens NBRC 106098 = DSM 45392]|uniref:Solute-binding protein family 3/N-terminal domain-containing protein n=1 Tax=Corynebacterium humireducens NBRC 106098 = DSM 45392 TaxID=1223515 RepID=A0A0B5D4V7_9CORY|nr:transporter substrate-binding domain-containing protein [Corynebacterium humireducens]AJE32032.1 hypothetical protein B842_00880 [Corynebacterium humireducens NBRC 106098 = DSM 45392]